MSAVFARSANSASLVFECDVQRRTTHALRVASLSVSAANLVDTFEIAVPNLLVARGALAGGSRPHSLPFLPGHHSGHIGKELSSVIDNAILDRPSNAPDSFGFASLVIQLYSPGTEEHLQILERVLIYNDEVGKQALSDHAELDGCSLRLM